MPFGLDLRSDPMQMTDLADDEGLWWISCRILNFFHWVTGFIWTCLWDGCCKHPSPLLVKHVLNTVMSVGFWTWVTDVASIRHLCWLNIAWVTDFSDIRHLCCVKHGAWVTDVASIRHLCWSNIAWVTDFSDIIHHCGSNNYSPCVCVCVCWGIWMTSVTQNTTESTYGHKSLRARIWLMA